MSASIKFILFVVLSVATVYGIMHLHDSVNHYVKEQNAIQLQQSIKQTTTSTVQLIDTLTLHVSD